MPLKHNLNIIYVGILPPHPGGAPISCTQLLKKLAVSGHKVRALAPVTSGSIQSRDLFAKKNPEIFVKSYIVPYNATNPVTPVPDEY